MSELPSTLSPALCGAGTAGWWCAVSAGDAGPPASAELSSAGPPVSVPFSPSHRAAISGGGDSRGGP